MSASTSDGLHPPDPRLPPVGRGDSYSEGIIDHLRSVEGTRSPPSRASCRRRPRTAQTRHRRHVDVSVIAPGGGGGPPGGGLRHRMSERTSSPSCANRSPRSCSGRSLLVDKPRGRPRTTSRSPRGGCWACARRYAGTLDPFATGLLLVVGRARWRFLVALPKRYVTVARLGAIGDPRGVTPAGAPLDVALPPGASSSRRLLGRPRAGAQGLRARATASSRCRARGRVYRFEGSGVGGPRPVLISARPGPTCARSSPSSATATAGCGAPHRAVPIQADPGRVVALEQALAFTARRDRCRRRGVLTTGRRSRRGRGRARSAGRRRRRSPSQPRRRGTAQARRRVPRMKVTRSPT